MIMARSIMIMLRAIFVCGWYLLKQKCFKNENSVIYSQHWLRPLAVNARFWLRNIVTQYPTSWFVLWEFQ